MRWLPVLAVVQRAAAAGGSEGNVAAGGDAPSDLVRAGDGAFVLVDGEVVEGEPALDRGLQRLGLDRRGIPGLPDRVPQVPVNTSTSASASLTSAETSASFAAG